MRSPSADYAPDSTVRRAWAGWLRAGLLVMAAVSAALVVRASAAAADVIRVTTQDDETIPSDQSCSLREAISFAQGGPASGCSSQAAPGTPRVVLPAGCYRLTDHELTITSDLAIEGAGTGEAACSPNGTVVRQDGPDRVLNLENPSSVVTLSGLTIAGGHPSCLLQTACFGGGVINSGTLTLQDVWVSANAAGGVTNASAFAGDGGGIFNGAGASLNVVDSAIAGNDAGNGAGSSFKGGAGGGIYNDAGHVTIVGSVVAGNSAGKGGDGTFGLGGTAGQSGGDGGGIFNSFGSTLSVGRSTISGNRAGGGGAGGGGSLTGGAGGGGGNGGGITSLDSHLALSASTVSGNAAGPGGPGGAGAASAGGSGGTGGSGGAVLAVSTGVVAISNATVSGNSAGAGGAGATGSPAGPDGSGGVGGGVETDVVTAISNSTIAANSAPSAGGILVGLDAHVTETATVIAANQGGSCAGAQIDDRGNNVAFGDDSCPGIHADPSLGPLRDNGGPTETMALPANSPAKDLVPPGPDCPSTDQRGVPRPQGLRCDAGAYEVAPPVIASASAAASDATSATIAAGIDAELQDTAVVVRYGLTTAYGATTAPIDVGSGSAAVPLSLPLSGLAPGTTYHAQVVATNADGATSSPDLAFTTPPAGAGSRRFAPLLSRVRQSAKRWLEGHGPVRASAHRRLPVGTTFSFTLNEPAAVVFTFTQNARRRRGGLALAAHQGVNRVRFLGVLGSGRRLKPGTYTVLITAAEAGVHSSPAKLTFTIVGRVS